ncbi:aminopeptidase [candidate division KSB1 bacterium]|nr:aminopeptidase [candidate division KSB1 bacterium]
MKDPRHVDLAKVLVHHSLKLKPGQKVLVETTDVGPEFIGTLIDTICAAGGFPVLEQKMAATQRALYLNATEARMKFIGDCELDRMKRVDAYIAVRGVTNAKEMTDVPGEQMSLYETHWMYPVHMLERMKKRWVVLRFPSGPLAQLARMSTAAFEDFYYRVCVGVDWAQADRAVQPAAAFMRKTDRVHIKGPADTDLKFSIKNIGVTPCCGVMNIPDLELFTAPVRDSVEGVIHYNCPSTYRGFTFENIRLRFERGKIVEATANDTKRINEVFNTDEGARYVGEFSLGFHPHIMDPMDDILFDEKINGSMHFTPGKAYEAEADNGNRSAIHWDLVMIQRPDYGGGEIYFDDVLIRKDGRFVHEAFLGMNPENLSR